MKLYWRVKINGKWTWRPAKLQVHYHSGCCVLDYEEE